MENKFILCLVLADSTCIHFILDTSLLVTGNACTVDYWKAIARCRPEFKLTEETINQIVDYKYWSIWNGVED